MPCNTAEIYGLLLNVECDHVPYVFTVGEVEVHLAEISKFPLAAWQKFMPEDLEKLSGQQKLTLTIHVSDASSRVFEPEGPLIETLATALRLVKNPWSGILLYGASIHSEQGMSWSDYELLMNDARDLDFTPLIWEEVNDKGKMEIVGDREALQEALEKIANQEGAYYPELGVVRANPDYLRRGSLGGGSCLLGGADLKSVQDVAQALWDLRGDRRLRAALKRFNMALDRSDYEDGIIDLCVALDAVLLRADPNARDRGAFMEKKAELILNERGGTAIAEGYWVRNQIVHGTEAQYDAVETFDRLRRDVRRILLALVTKPSLLDLVSDAPASSN